MRTQNLLWLKLAVLTLSLGLVAGAFFVIRNGYRQGASVLEALGEVHSLIEVQTRRPTVPPIVAWEAYCGELAASGEPLSLAEFEARRPTVPPDDNAALVIEEVAEELALLKADASQMVPFLSQELRHIDPFVGIPQAALKPMRAFLKQHESTIDALSMVRDLTGARLTKTIYDASGDNPLEGMLPTLGAWLDAGKLQHLLALSHLIDGDTNKAADAVAVQFGVAASLRNEPSMIARTTRGLVLQEAVYAIEASLRVGELDQERLVELAVLIDAQRESLSPKTALQFERALRIKLFDSLAAGKVPLSEVYGESSLGHVSLAEFREAQLLITKAWTELIEVADDHAELHALADRLSSGVSPLSMRFRMYDLAGDWMPDGTFSGFLGRSIAVLRCALAALACERYRLRHGRLPQSLAELVPDFVEAMPIDPFTGEPLLFITTDVGITVYSIGSNLIDDGGDFTVPKGEYYSPDNGFRLAALAKRGTIVAEAAPPGESP